VHVGAAGTNPGLRASLRPLEAPLRDWRNGVHASRSPNPLLPPPGSRSRPLRTHHSVSSAASPAPAWARHRDLGWRQPSPKRRYPRVRRTASALAHDHPATGLRPGAQSGRRGLVVVQANRGRQFLPRRPRPPSPHASSRSPPPQPQPLPAARLPPQKRTFLALTVTILRETL